MKNDLETILNTAWNDLLNFLLIGNRNECSLIINKLINTNIPVIEIYEKVLKKALYKVGELWEFNKISVATEHLASAIVESIINEIYYKVIIENKRDKIALVACIEDEFHQIGIKMVSDVFEMNGWNTYFLGSNTPSAELLNYAKQINPDIIAISLSIYFHMPQLENLIVGIRSISKKTPILVGGQAFLHGGISSIQKFENVIYKPDLESTEIFIKNLY